MQALLDTDVVLDVLLAREPFRQPAKVLWEAHRHRHFNGFVSALTPVNVYYIARKLKGRDAAQKAVADVIGTFEVCTIDERVLQSALALGFPDFEDAVQHASAQARGLDAIVTRNLRDFARSTLPAVSPTDFLAQLGLDSE